MRKWPCVFAPLFFPCFFLRVRIFECACLCFCTYVSLCVGVYVCVLMRRLFEGPRRVQTATHARVAGMMMAFTCSAYRLQHSLLSCAQPPSTASVSIKQPCSTKPPLPAPAEPSLLCHVPSPVTVHSSCRGSKTAGKVCTAAFSGARSGSSPSLSPKPLPCLAAITKSHHSTQPLRSLSFSSALLCAPPLGHPTQL